MAKKYSSSNKTNNGIQDYNRQQAISTQYYQKSANLSRLLRWLILNYTQVYLHARVE